MSWSQSSYVSPFFLSQMSKDFKSANSHRDGGCPNHNPRNCHHFSCRKSRKCQQFSQSWWVSKSRSANCHCSPHHCVGFLLLGLLPPTDRPTTDRPTDDRPTSSSLTHTRQTHTRSLTVFSSSLTHTRHAHVDSLTRTRQTHTRSLTVFYTHTRHTHVDSLTHTSGSGRCH